MDFNKRVLARLSKSILRTPPLLFYTVCLSSSFQALCFRHIALLHLEQHKRFRGTHIRTQARRNSAKHAPEMFTAYCHKAVA